MSLRVAGPDKSRVIDLLTHVLQRLTFSGITRLQQEQTMQHLAALQMMPEELDVYCRLEAFESGMTKITITATPITRLPDATKQ